MKIKANTSFAGAVSMYAGEVRDVDDKTAKALISCGYAEKNNAKADTKASEDVKQNENK